MIFELLLVFSPVVVAYILTTMEKFKWKLYARVEFITITGIIACYLITLLVCMGTCKLTDYTPTAEYNLEEISTNTYAIHSADGKYYVRYNGSTTFFVDVVVIDINSTDNTEPKLISCAFNPSVIVSSWFNIDVKHILVISNDQIREETFKPTPTETPELPEWI